MRYPTSTMKMTPTMTPTRRSTSIWMRYLVSEPQLKLSTCVTNETSNPTSNPKRCPTTRPMRNLMRDPMSNPTRDPRSNLTRNPMCNSMCNPKCNPLRSMVCESLGMPSTSVTYIRYWLLAAWEFDTRNNFAHHPNQYSHPNLKHYSHCCHRLTNVTLSIL